MSKCREALGICFTTYLINCTQVFYFYEMIKNNELKKKTQIIYNVKQLHNLSCV